MNELAYIGPEILIALTGLLILLLGVTLKGENEMVWRGLTALATIGALIWNFAHTALSNPILGGLVMFDDFARFFNGIFLGVLLLIVIGYGDYLKNTHIPVVEFYSLLLFAVVGLMALASSTNMMVLFVGLELLSIALYALVGLLKGDVHSREAILKYFIMGSFASAFLLFGISLLFGFSGSLDLVAIREAIHLSSDSHSVLLVAGILLLVTGLAFKVSAVPFHFWTPDVYDGAPTLVTAFMATAVKAGAVAMMGRILVTAVGGESTSWIQVLIWLSVLTMTLGNLVALVQTSIKRMLAYSAIAHAGYLLIGVLVAPAASGHFQPVFFYLVPYALMNVGIFLVIMLVNGQGENRSYALDDYKGLGLRYPLYGLIISVFMLSLAGIPPTAGFMGKFYLFSAAVETGHVVLAVIAVLNAVVSVFYYLRVVVYMYFHEGSEEVTLTHSGGVLLATTIAVLLILLLGVFPNLLLDQLGAPASFMAYGM